MGLLGFYKPQGLKKWAFVGVWGFRITKSGLLGFVGFRASKSGRLLGVYQDRPNGSLMEPLWSFIVGIWGIIEGSWGV